MKRNFLWLTWGLLSLMVLLTMGYKSVASELEKYNETQKKPVLLDPLTRP